MGKVDEECNFIVQVEFRDLVVGKGEKKFEKFKIYGRQYYYYSLSEQIEEW